MNLNDAEMEKLAAIQAYAAEHGFYLNPDESVVERVVRGLILRHEKTGVYYCPCRLTSGDPEKDAGIACPCEHHEEEIRTQGHCHCYLLVSKEYYEKHRG